MEGLLSGERESALWFELDIRPFRADWKGKLVVNWPPAREWCRNAHTTEIPIHAILEDSVLDGMMPEWSAIDLSWAELSQLPAKWREALKQWRGIYFIFDEFDGKGYVGSAYGANNLDTRWQEYAATGHGGNKLLINRDENNFRFTILQRVSPDMDADEVIRLEASWKNRLHTRAPWGLNDN